jgi:hypothetical protein
MTVPTKFGIRDLVGPEILVADGQLLSATTIPGGRCIPFAQPAVGPGLHTKTV